MQPRLNSASQISYADPQSNEKIVEETTAHADQIITDAFYVLCILIMLAWPWIFFGVVFSKGGIPARPEFAMLVTDNPQKTNFVVTLIGTLVRIIVGYFFSKAVLRYSQKWVMENSQDITLFDVSLMSAFKSRNLPWDLSDRKYLVEHKRWLRVILVGVCIGAFVIVPSGITSMISPIPFNQTAPVFGTEINLATNDTECLAWINNQSLSSPCDYQSYHGANYTSCLDGELQSFDLLGSIRTSIDSLDPSDPGIVEFDQLGANSGLQFIGSIRGVLPAGPRGHPAADTLKPSPLSDPQNNVTILSYNLTLWQQGLSTSVLCTYEDQSPITTTKLPGETSPIMLLFSGSCDGQDADLFQDSAQFLAYNASSTLTFWACRSPPSVTEEQSSGYSVYLKGSNFYESQIGNITCTISPPRSAIFPVSYSSTLGAFYVGNEESVDDFTTSTFLDQSMVALGQFLQDAQTIGSNQVVELINSLAVEGFGMQKNSQSQDFLAFYEAMIQGILEYSATYSRMLYSTAIGRPTSCDRKITGVVSYSVIGWKVEFEHVGTLMPMTLINLASLIIMLLAIFKTRVYGYKSDLTDVKTLALANLHLRPGNPSVWDDGVTYRQREQRVRAE